MTFSKGGCDFFVGKVYVYVGVFTVMPLIREDPDPDLKNICLWIRIRYTELGTKSVEALKR
jgi:hypothetical protein